MDEKSSPGVIPVCRTEAREVDSYWQFFSKLMGEFEIRAARSA